MRVYVLRCCCKNNSFISTILSLLLINVNYSPSTKPCIGCLSMHPGTAPTLKKAPRRLGRGTLFSDLVGFDQTEFAVFSAVHDTCAVRFSIFEDKEVVSKHIHL